MNLATSPAHTKIGRRLAQWDAAMAAQVDHRAVIPLRMAAGVLTLAQLTPMLAESLRGVTYRDSFHIPPPAWFPQLAEPAYVAALWVAAAAAVAAALGLRTRLAIPTAAAFVAYHLLVSETHYHHNRAFLLVVLVALALMPVGERLSLDAALGRVQAEQPGWGPQWPLLLLRLQVAIVYLASGVSKLLDPDWLSGVVLQLRVDADSARAITAGIPSYIVDAAASAGFQWWFAKMVIATEIVIGIGLLVRRMRWGAVWVAIAFHLAIELTADVELFSWLAMATLLIWVTPTGRRRTLVAPARWATVVRAADWTGRFRVTAGDTWCLDEGPGTVKRGEEARLRTGVLLPATFFFVAPFQLVRHTLRRVTRLGAR